MRAEKRVEISDEARRAAQRVLIAEDDPDIAGLIGHYLERAGCETEIVASGRDVLGRFRGHPFALLILDLLLPQLDGPEVCRTPRASRAWSWERTITSRSRSAQRAGRQIG